MSPALKRMLHALDPVENDRTDNPLRRPFAGEDHSLSNITAPTQKGEFMRIMSIAPKNGFAVIAGTERSQAATMVLAAGESTGGEDNRHAKSDQWLYVIDGSGEAEVNGRYVPLTGGSLLLIEAGEIHSIRNTGDVLLQTLNFYAPPEYEE
jgi:mannose-6-phosphate isomerase-like protein (cupin superfamily)